MLVVEGVGELVGDDGAHVRAGLGAAHHQLVGLGVVEADDAGAEQRTQRRHQVGPRLDQPEGLEDEAGRDDVVGVLLEVLEQPGLEGRVVLELDGDLAEERQAPLGGDELLDVGDHPFEVVSRRRAGCRGRRVIGPRGGRLALLGRLEGDLVVGVVVAVQERREGAAEQGRDHQHPDDRHPRRDPAARRAVGLGRRGPFDAGPDRAGGRGRRRRGQGRRRGELRRAGRDVGHRTAHATTDRDATAVRARAPCVRRQAPSPCPRRGSNPHLWRF